MSRARERSHRRIERAERDRGLFAECGLFGRADIDHGHDHGDRPTPPGMSYVYKLSGTFRDVSEPRRDSNPRSVVLLGTSGACSGSTDTISITGAASMRVYGDAFINTTDGASCNAMDLQNSGVWKAGGTNIFTGGTCVDSGSSVCPTVTTTTTRVADPYASLTAPSTSGLPAQTGCTGAQSSQTAQPGLYSSGFNLGGGDTCTLASGIYVVQGGFNVGNGATLKTGSGGVLIYLMSGQFIDQRRRQRHLHGHDLGHLLGPGALAGRGRHAADHVLQRRRARVQRRDLRAEGSAADHRQRADPDT